ncbi:hypothetical protein COU57_04910 [Candidatus Pacearchaeota archaeon CG10_big_fil_rev_8_21_14_0_10_32_14]|nr:MAG: hypothetical protein COU57_04910 [Candidatus Pacearchaeota archaeon CG10_big_fil_rev_8_21_14_0_10_32_14]
MVKNKPVTKKTQIQKKDVILDVALIVMYKGRVLLGEKMASRHDGIVWDLPGGKREGYESPMECGIRETLEETGLDVKLIDRHSCAETYDEYATGKTESTLIYRSKPIINYEPSTMEKNKFLQWAYFPWNALPKNKSLCLRNLKKQRYDPFKK